MASSEDRFPNRKKWVIGMVIFLMFFSGFPTSAFVFKTGECRSIAETVKNFDITKFIGTWYVIQSSNTAARCHTISFKENSGSFAFIVNKQIYSLLAAGIVHNLHYEAQVFPNPKSPASMVVRMPSSLYSDISYEVIGTDYKNWAVMWACKNQMFGHLESGLVLSRTNTLSIESLTLIRKDLQSLGVTSLSTVQQKDCNPKLGGGFFTLELASGTTSVSVDWETLIPDSQLPSEITDGCFVQEGNYFYFREVCPSSNTTSETDGTNSTGEYYYYYYDDPDEGALDGGDADNSDIGDNQDNDGTEGDYYYYYYEDGASGDEYYDAEGLDGSGEQYYEYSSSGDDADAEYTDEYYYYYDDYSGDEYYDGEYYGDEYYSDEYYDDEYATAELQMATVEKDLDDINESDSIQDYLEVDKYSISDSLPEIASRNWSLLLDTAAGDIGDIAWKVKGDSIASGRIPKSIIPQKDNINMLLEKDETGELIERDVSLGLLRTKRDSKSKEVNKSVEKVVKVSNEHKMGESSSPKKGELLKISKDNKDKKDMEGNAKLISKNKKSISDKKPGQNKENKGKSKKKGKIRKKKRRKGKKKKRRRNKNKGRKGRRSRRKRKRKNRKRGKNKRNKNPLVAKLIMMSGRLQKFLMTHNIGIRKLPVDLRLKDLYSYFRDKREKRRLRRLVKRAKRIWGSKVKRKVKKKGKKNMKIFKNKSTWKKSKKSGKKRRRNKKGGKVKGRRRKGKRIKKGKRKKTNNGKGDKTVKIKKKSNNERDKIAKNSADINIGKLNKNGNMEIQGNKGDKTGGILKVKKLKRRKKKKSKGKLSRDKRRKKKLRRKERKKMRKKMRKRMRKKLKKKMKGRRKDGKQGKKRKGNKKKRKKNKKGKKRNKRRKKKRNRNNGKGKQNKKKQLEKKLNKKEKKNKKDKVDGMNEGNKNRDKKNRDNDKEDKEMKELLKSLGL
ncbi:calponin homology domain-containing protein DDB_G0272472-like [Palaemon carinicauda]|uniref:calponin homology domain-containing protein DDB_G0272472-like n=1 Tax=Palaemon carinicauda TaxID=392227 RepID=UPI0035B6608E